jgi:Mn2+/Fe2+ NRAMP family transporter
VLSSVLNGILLPFVLVFALSLVNNKKIMGEHVNSKSHNYISWATIITLIVLTATLLVMTVAPQFKLYI